MWTTTYHRTIQHVPTVIIICDYSVIFKNGTFKSASFCASNQGARLFKWSLKVVAQTQKVWEWKVTLLLSPWTQWAKCHIVSQKLVRYKNHCKVKTIVSNPTASQHWIPNGENRKQYINTQ